MKAMYLLMLLLVTLVKAGSEAPSGQNSVADGNPLDSRYEREQERSNEHSHENVHVLGCSSQRLCDENEGVCRSSCNGQVENEVHAGCRGTGCKCCTRKAINKCTSNEECREHRGKCTQNKCKSFEVQIRGGCKGQGCRCCARPIRDAEGELNEDLPEGMSGEQIIEETGVKQEGEGEEQNEHVVREEEDNERETEEEE